jgi:hypothetical protein
MSEDSFIGVIKFVFKQNYNTLIKYTIINSEYPENYRKSIKNFKKNYDINNLLWLTSKTEAYEIANMNDSMYPTAHGIISIDYTKEETLETIIMYSSEYRYLNGIKNISSIGFNFIINVLYLLFIIKLYSNLFY